MTSEIIPKSSKNEVPRPSKHCFEKLLHNSAKKLETVPEIFNFGDSRGGQQTMFFDPWAVLGDPGGPAGPQTAPQNPHDPPNLDF